MRITARALPEGREGLAADITHIRQLLLDAYSCTLHAGASHLPLTTAPRCRALHHCCAADLAAVLPCMSCAVEQQRPDLCLEPLKRLDVVHGLLVSARIKLEDLDDDSEELGELRRSREDCR